MKDMGGSVRISTPLKMYVLWHQNCVDGIKYAEAIYYEYCRKPEDYAGESIGIPVYFENQPILDIGSAIANAERVVFVLLVDASMGCDEKWRHFADKLYDYSERNKNVVIYPVAINSNNVIRYFNERLAEVNYIRLTGNGTYETKKVKLEEKCKCLLFELTHELTRLLYSRERISENNPEALAAIKIFISHARADGGEYARIINSCISDTPLDSFIDVYDVARGKRIQDEIDRNIDSSALLVLYTDSYSSREWCQHEVLYAKLKGRPIVLVDILNKGELRRFPYFANVKSIHIGHISEDKTKIEEVIYAILLESLKIKYTQTRLEYIAKLFKLNKTTKIFAYPPELYTLLMMEDKKAENNSHEEIGGIDTILYPEPPLNKNEMEIITKFSPKMHFITPTFVFGLKDGVDNLKHCGLNVGISISEVVDEIHGARNNLHLNVIYIELCRYLLAINANLVHGGDINYSKKYNFVEILNNLIENYCFYENRKGKVLNLYPSDKVIDNETRLKYNNNINFEPVELSLLDYKDKLSEFRKALNDKCDIRIAIGGKTQGYCGKMPGVVEEVYLALNSNKPVYLVGAFGGATKYIVDCIEGNESEQIVPFEIEEFFKKLGYKGLNNGLDEEENKLLCHSEDSIEIISLILKGLNR